MKKVYILSRRKVDATRRYLKLALRMDIRVYLAYRWTMCGHTSKNEYECFLKEVRDSIMAARHELHLMDELFGKEG